jgi:allophanate hydrolase
MRAVYAISDDMPVEFSLNLAALRARLRDGALTPVGLARAVLAANAGDDHHRIWIHRVPEADVLARAAALEADPAARALPLYGVPFAVKDNIDVAGMPTTAACPAYAYTPARHATVVQRLLDAGAILIGKTNLDQFATGLVGTRSPYGACRNAFDPAYIAGGSSSGSAVAVARNLVSFALGTDTAGSGRVPAGFNNIVGLKPTRGLLSTSGVVPACRSLDCVSVFAATAADAWTVFATARAYDAADAYSRPPQPSLHLPAGEFRCGVPRAGELEFCGDRDSERLYRGMLDTIARSGGLLVEIDFAPLRETAALLYQGPWIAERMAALGGFFDAHAGDLLPVTREIIGGATAHSAVSAFAAQYRLQALRRAAAAEFAKIDVLAVPTAPTIYTIAEVEADPIGRNAKLGYYTNFVNLLDLSAIAVPAGLPNGLTLIGPARAEPLLCELGDRLQAAGGLPLGATQFAQPPAAGGWRDAAGDASVRIAVVGAHLSGMPLNHQLTERGAQLEGTARTAPDYRFYLLPDTTPPKPGLVRCAEGAGHSIEVEIWRMPAEHYGSFVAGIAPPLGIGTLRLQRGGSVQGFLCEAVAVGGALDISACGGWRAYLRNQAPPVAD